jgi:3-oxoacyl-[acyl-carrier-protein] synthase III
MAAVITGIGAAVPEQRVTNADLVQRLDTTDDWIVERTGIRERRIAGQGESTASLAIAAGADAIKDAGLVPDDVGLLLVATTTPDQMVPSTAAVVQDGLSLSCGAVDLNAACAGFVYGLVFASAMPTTTLLVGAETLSRIVDPDDRSTAVLFGDGAGAVVLEPSDRPGLLGWDLGADGSLAHLLEMPAGERWLRMQGSEVFRRAVRVIVDSSAAALERAGLTVEDVDWFVPHQANRRIIDAAASRMGIPSEHVVVNIERYGNTSAASIPLALSEACIEPGQIVLLSGFGAGMTWASAVMAW